MRRRAPLCRKNAKYFVGEAASPRRVTSTPCLPMSLMHPSDVDTCSGSGRKLFRGGVCCPAAEKKNENQISGRTASNFWTGSYATPSAVSGKPMCCKNWGSMCSELSTSAGNPNVSLTLDTC